MKRTVVTLAAALLFPVFPAAAWADGPDDDGAWTDDEPAEAPAQTTVIIEGAGNGPSDADADANTTAATTAVAPGMVRLFIESPKRVAVYETHGRNKLGRKVCDSPCGKMIDGSRGEQFVVKGRGVGTSPAFDLQGLQGDTRLVVDPGSRGRKAGGIVMVVFGGLGLAAGTLAGAWAIWGEGDEDMRTAAGIGGGAAFLGGAGLLTGGIALLAGSGTEVEVVPQGRAPSVEPADDEWSRATPRPREVRPVYWRGEF